MTLFTILLDSSTYNLSIALFNNDQALSRINISQLKHEENILRYLDSFIKDGYLSSLKEITHICCGIGPGSFTGTRVGCAMVQALKACLDIKTITFSSMYAIAATIHASRGNNIYTVIKHANIHQVYYGIYDMVNRCTITETICLTEEVSHYAEGFVISDLDLKLSIDSGCELDVFHMYPHVQPLIEAKQFHSVIYPSHYD